MLETRRHTLDALRRGPALFAGLPGDEVDLDRLAGHLARRGIEGSIYAADGSLEGLLWISHGAPGEAWFFEAGGQDAVLPVTTSRDLLLEIASRGGHISVFVGTAPAVAPPVFESPAETFADEDVAAIAVEIIESVEVPAEVTRAAPAEAEPAAHPWPAILADVMARVVRHRGPRLAEQFAAALDRALEPHGGRVEGDRVVAPPLPESAWRGVVEAGCVPVVAVAGRAFVERTIAAAERTVDDAAGDIV